MDKEAEILLKQIDQIAQMLSDAITAGRPEDYAHYKYVCGQINGLHQARTAIQILTKRLEFED